MENEEVMAKGYLEKIGLPDSFLTSSETHLYNMKVSCCPLDICKPSGIQLALIVKELYATLPERYTLGNVRVELSTEKGKAGELESNTDGMIDSRPFRSW